jgi:hypothetical protein
MLMATVLPLLVLDPTTLQFDDGLALAGGPPRHSLTPAAARYVQATPRRCRVMKPPAAIEATTFAVGPTRSVRIESAPQCRGAGHGCLPRA